MIPTGFRLEVPVDPEPPEATQWLIEELAKPQYQAAKPTLFDLIAQSISDWINSLRFSEVQGPPALGLAFVVGLILVGIVVAFLIFGVPRLNRRSRITGTLFGDDDNRSAAQIRQAAEAAAARGDWATAIAEQFRAIARGLAERGILTTSPGTTARSFADRAGHVLPELLTRLTASAGAFDEVRYLGHSGSEHGYREVAALEADVRSARPELEAAAK